MNASRGYCERCGGLYGLSAAGLIHRHSAAGNRSVSCAGSERPPAPPPELVVRRREPARAQP